MSLACRKLAGSSMLLLIHPKDLTVYRLYAMHWARCWTFKEDLCQSVTKSTCLRTGQRALPRAGGSGAGVGQRRRPPADVGLGCGQAEALVCTVMELFPPLRRARGSISAQLEYVACTQEKGRRGFRGAASSFSR
uniref:Uncharacterized protein n=1 Tax=Molossus molossus TaxID=27622 RepID=A0A7J8GKV7_MOLMO|nr:hypothetical protein HJG59_011506 [Molossus molossus]